MLPRVGDQLRTCGDTQLLLNVRPVGLDGSNAEEQRTGDFNVGVAARDQLDNFYLARRELVRPAFALGGNGGQLGAELGIEVGAALSCELDRVHKLGVSGVLEHVA